MKGIAVRALSVGILMVALLTTACAAETTPAKPATPTTVPPASADVTTTTTVPPSANAATSTVPGAIVTVTTQPSSGEKGGGVKVKPTAPVYGPGDGMWAVIADLANRLGVDESRVTVVSQEEVTWSDGSLGCPEPGMMYTQALVSGSLVILEVEGVRYAYHSGDRRDPFYCATPMPPVEAGAGGS